VLAEPHHQLESLRAFELRNRSIARAGVNLAKHTNHHGPIGFDKATRGVRSLDVHPLDRRDVCRGKKFGDRGDVGRGTADRRNTNADWFKYVSIAIGSQLPTNLGDIECNIDHHGQAASGRSDGGKVSELAGFVWPSSDDDRWLPRLATCARHPQSER